jgi:Domain of unknown function (DUF4411)
MAYLLDSNVFIEAKRLHYGFDFCPAFWDWLDLKARQGVVASISKVASELVGQGDDLSEWIREREAVLCIEPTAPTLSALSKVSAWATGGKFQPSAVATFLEVADSYLVAEALAGGHTVVTREKADNAVTRIKIPNACVAFQVKCISPYDMLRREQARFVLGTET